LAAKAAYVYACVLLAIVTLLLGLSLFLHVSALSGALEFSKQLELRMVLVVFLTAFAGVGLARERNVWKNEFKSCPVWMRATVLALMIYGWVSGFIQIASSGASSVAEEAIIATASGLFLGAFPLCTLYAVVFKGSASGSELVSRVPISTGLTALVFVLFLAGRAGYLPHPGR
jgi:hypothetical protein